MDIFDKFDPIKIGEEIADTGMALIELKELTRLKERLAVAEGFVQAIAARKHGTSHSQEWETIIEKAQAFLTPAPTGKEEKP